MAGDLAASNPTHLEGSVERVTFYNSENGFSVLRVRLRGHREPITVVGTLPAAQPGERLDQDFKSSWSYEGGRDQSAAQ
jgi:hypothetical protein